MEISPVYCVDRNVLWVQALNGERTYVTIDTLRTLNENLGDSFPFSPSALNLYPKATIHFDSKSRSFGLFVSCAVGDVLVEVPFISDRFSNYILIGKRWKRVGGIDALNASIEEAGIANPSAFDLEKYLMINKNPEKFFAGIPFALLDPSILKNIASCDTVQPKHIVNANLFKYQETGLAWLDFVSSTIHGGILADEMGLGKTLQIISLIALKIRKGRTGPYLIVAPVSLIENWRREINRFAPQIDVYVHGGAHRTGLPQILAQHQVVVTAYTTLLNDSSIFYPIVWEAVFLDEAQAIKNPDAQRTIAVKKLSRKGSFCISGTPFQNHMLDIWSLVDFALPNYLGTKETFLNQFDDDLNGARAIEPIITPIMLRRTVSEVGNDLPDKIEVPQAIEMGLQESEIYESIRQQTLDQYSATKVATLPLISKLRMCAANPILTEKTLGRDPFTYSAKYQRLVSLLEEIIYNREKAIIFTSFVEMIEIMCADLANRLEIPTFSIYGKINGAERQKVIDEFTELEGSAILVINPNAAGVGLNIVSANHVIHYTPEWNPAIEDQATARAYRRGQVRNVFVYKLFYANTVEDFMANKIAVKRDMIENAIVGCKGRDQTMEDIVKALSLSPKEDR